MMIVDTALRRLQEQRKPVRVGLVGAGFAGRGFALQMLTAAVGMRLVAISNRTVSRAAWAFSDGGVDNPTTVSSAQELRSAIENGEYAITDDPILLCESDLIDVIVEATGTIEFGAHVIMRAIEHHKHVVLINAELDTTLGPILKVYADRAGVVYTQADGDQPAALMNLYRHVQSLGFKPVLAGNIKSLIDCRRTPATQAQFAKDHWQESRMITSFADGTKISFEMATVANATGFRVGKRGMYGPACSHVDEAHRLFPLEKLPQGGIVDYILGAQPSFGVFVLGYSDHPIKQRYMKVYKMGEGPLFTFYTPYHLSPLEAPLSVARAALFNDAALAPLGAPVCNVVTFAKRDLKTKEVLDGIGGFTCYGAIDNVDVLSSHRLLPMGLSDSCTLKHDVAIDTPLTYDDVNLPQGRLAERLCEEQNTLFKKVA